MIRATHDFYKYDVITNIERVNPLAVTFPAITVCPVANFYKKLHFKNGSAINTEYLYGNSVSIKNFVHQASFDSDSWIYDSFKDTEPFNIPDQSADCLRFNGALNKPTELYKANGSHNGFRLFIYDFYYEYISVEYYQYSVNQEQQQYYFSSFISDNILNSFDKIFRHELSPYKGP